MPARKYANKNYGNEEVFNFVKDPINGVFEKEVFKKLLNILVQNQSVKRNKIGNPECLLLPKETLQVSHELLTSGQKPSQLIEDSSKATVEALCSKTFTQSNFEGAFKS